MKNQLLIIFAKNPVEGRVKTRLARTVGQVKALKIYNALLSYTKQVTMELDIDRQIWFSDQIPVQSPFNANGYEPLVQQGEDLGERMLQAFQRAFDQGYEQVTIIGTDCAFITSDHIDRAFERLNEVEVVLGPSADGGYYLLGMRQLHPFLFKDKSWSTADLFDETTQALERRGIVWEALPCLNDVDTWKDWLEARERIQNKVKQDIE